MMNNKKELLRDPIRYVLMAELCAKGKALLLAALMAVYYVIILKMGAAMQGVAIIAAVGVLGAALLTAAPIVLLYVPLPWCWSSCCCAWPVWR